MSPIHSQRPTCCCPEPWTDICPEDSMKEFTRYAALSVYAAEKWMQSQRPASPTTSWRWHCPGEPRYQSINCLAWGQIAHILDFTPGEGGSRAASEGGRWRLCSVCLRLSFPAGQRLHESLTLRGSQEPSRSFQRAVIRAQKSLHEGGVSKGLGGQMGRARVPWS